MANENEHELGEQSFNSLKLKCYQNFLHYYFKEICSVSHSQKHSGSGERERSVIRNHGANCETANDV